MWFAQAMYWRMIFSVMMTLSLALLLWDFLTIGHGEIRPAKPVPREPDAP